MRAQRFFYLCAGFLLLVVAYTIGAGRAQGQAPSTRIVAAASFGQNNAGVIAIREDGRVYRGWFGVAPGEWEEMTPVPGTASF